MNQLDQTKKALLKEASRTLNTVSKVKQEREEFVKCKRSYSHPEEIRTLYLQALDSLIEDGLMNLVVTNEYLDLYEVKEGEVKEELTVSELSPTFFRAKNAAELCKKLRSLT